MKRGRRKHDKRKSYARKCLNGRKYDPRGSFRYKRLMRCVKSLEEGKILRLVSFEKLTEADIQWAKEEFAKNRDIEKGDDACSSTGD